jgi:hypothetical protein
LEVAQSMADIGEDAVNVDNRNARVGHGPFLPEGAAPE